MEVLGALGCRLLISRNHWPMPPLAHHCRPPLVLVRNFLKPLNSPKRVKRLLAIPIIRCGWSRRILRVEAGDLGPLLISSYFVYLCTIVYRVSYFCMFTTTHCQRLILL